MDWRLFATLSEAAGGNEVAVSVDAADPTVRDAFDALLAAEPALADEVLDENGELYDHVRLLHDGVDPFAEAEGFDTPIRADDELALFPPVSGG
jgi:molybdopterin synthase sulfur carrier subunit